MPTGYTAKLYDGDQDFDEFVLTAARNFGALIEMRDMSLDAAIPDEFVPSAYHQEHRDEAAARLAEVKGLTDDECHRRALVDYDRWDVETKASAAETAARLARYEAMRERALAWHPPTDDHTGLRDFMVQQLDESSRFDCHEWAPPPPTVDGSEWRAEQIAKAERDIAYNERELAADRERATERTAWVRALRASLRKPVTP